MEGVKRRGDEDEDERKSSRKSSTSSKSDVPEEECDEDEQELPPPSEIRKSNTPLKAFAEAAYKKAKSVLQGNWKKQEESDAGNLLVLPESSSSEASEVKKTKAKPIETFYEDSSTPFHFSDTYPQELFVRLFKNFSSKGSSSSSTETVDTLVYMTPKKSLNSSGTIDNQSLMQNVQSESRDLVHESPSPLEAGSLIESTIRDSRESQHTTDSAVEPDPQPTDSPGLDERTSQLRLSPTNESQGEGTHSSSENQAEKQK
jgi:hypothetical protein